MLKEARITPDALKMIHPNISVDHDPGAIHADSGNIIDHFAKNADPSLDKIYTPWIVNRYRQQALSQSDAPDIHQTLTDFHNNKSKLAQKDINQYKSLQDIKNAVAPVADQMSRKAQKRFDKDTGAEELHNDNGIMVQKLHTHAAACQYGAGTKWCTSGRTPDSFNSYKKNGDLYAIHAHDGSKYQLFINKNEDNPHHHELRDAVDLPMPISHLVKRYPELTNVEELKNSPIGFHFAKTPEQTQAMLIPQLQNNADPATQAEAFNHPGIPTDYLKQVLKNKYSSDAAAEGAASHPNADKDVLNMALRHPSLKVRAKAVRNPNATADHIAKALKDPSPYVVAHAAFSPKVTSDQIDKLMNHPDENVRANAVSNPKASREAIMRGLADPSHSVSFQASRHPKVTDTFLKSAMRHLNPRIRAAAQSLVARNQIQGM